MNFLRSFFEPILNLSQKNATFLHRCIEKCVAVAPLHQCSELCVRKTNLRTVRTGVILRKVTNFNIKKHNHTVFCSILKHEWFKDLSLNVFPSFGPSYV